MKYLIFFINNTQKTIPVIGKFVVGSSKPYEYLVKSIDQFYNQNELIKLMKNNGFSKRRIPKSF